jgi:hypothetical protein
MLMWTRERTSRYLACYFVRLLLSAAFLVASSMAAYKLAYQGMSQLYGSADVRIMAGSELETCLNSHVKQAHCMDVLLNRTVPGLEVPVLTYSYEPNEDHWTMRSWGPVAQNCVAPRQSSWSQSL